MKYVVTYMKQHKQIRQWCLHRREVQALSFLYGSVLVDVYLEPDQSTLQGAFESMLLHICNMGIHRCEKEQLLQRMYNLADNIRRTGKFTREYAEDIKHEINMRMKERI